MPAISKNNAAKPIPLVCIEQDDAGTGNISKAGLSKFEQNWLTANGFSGQAGKLLALPNKTGALGSFVFGMGEKSQRPPLLLGGASAKLPSGSYSLEGETGDKELAALAFKLGSYRFSRYKDQGGEVTLFAGQASEEVDYLSEAAFLARDLINTPANDLGPDAFEARIRAFAKTSDMNCKTTAGEALLEQNLPMIHAVGRASCEAPRLIELSWGAKDAPKVTLVGKGVTFDTGGLDIKTAAGMVLMKKDMGGAANILGLAHAIVSASLKVRLRVLLPVVENAIAGNAFRPGDVLVSRAGLSVEIGNTDAEGRLILADALALASEDEPQLLIDMATLTGAARVALGPDLPPLYSTSTRLARQLVEEGTKWGDPLWHMPLWKPYEANLSSRIAHINHISPGGFAGSLTAALFLQKFVKNVDEWVHMDIFGWAPEARPGRTQGGTDQGIRAAFMMLKKRYAQ